ncbi:DUF6484 domain-containing protein [Variovorax sp. J22R133]|uniref:DUF6484 domain-containing protein n=1 Tax=Variovorax brevis TaxID=3053503 RepID=UPI002577F5EF|nr:DUF6484 domain-containing protein [Variovorax sp. J22R133]MDM0112266.1 DUF6484 domain-containing protein [Variovorax sp. J22R133]
MQREHLPEEQLILADAEPGQPDALALLLSARPVVLRQHSLPEVVIGELIAITDDGCTPLVLYAGQPGRVAVRARTVLNLHAAHIGRQVVLSFDNGDAALPIVMGVLQPAVERLVDASGKIEVETDGDRVVVSARKELVLRCGKASIKLTSAGKVLIDGGYVQSRSTGANRIKGGSVQIN